jgi:hypothetical protein
MSKIFLRQTYKYIIDHVSLEAVTTGMMIFLGNNNPPAEAYAKS